jgi:hypothetical protein
LERRTKLFGFNGGHGQDLVGGERQAGLPLRDNEQGQRFLGCCWQARLAARFAPRRERRKRRLGGGVALYVLTEHGLFDALKSCVFQRRRRVCGLQPEVLLDS